MRVQLLSGATATNGAPQAKATGTITTVAVASLVDGETFTIWDGERMYTFEFDVNGTGVTSPNVQVDVSADTTADEVRDRIVTAINASAIRITAASGGAATVALTADLPGEVVNRAMAETVANGTFAVSGMSGADDGGWLVPYNSNKGLFQATKAHLALKSTAGSGTMDVTIKLWGFIDGIDDWFPMGTHATAATKGIINEGNAIGETGGNTIHHLEVVEFIRGLKKIYAEVVSINGTATAIDAWLVGISE